MSDEALAQVLGAGRLAIDGRTEELAVLVGGIAAGDEGEAFVFLRGLVRAVAGVPGGADIALAAAEQGGQGSDVVSILQAERAGDVEGSQLAAFLVTRSARHEPGAYVRTVLFLLTGVGVLVQQGLLSWPQVDVRVRLQSPDWN